MPSLLGSTLGPYQILEQIGLGGKSLSTNNQRINEWLWRAKYSFIRFTIR